MPNHTDNYFVVAGPTEQVEEFAALVRDTESSRALSFQRLVPCPPAFFDRVSPNRVEGFEQCDWYGWCLAHWGTKWDAYDTTQLSTVIQDDVAAISYTFHTAWSPPEHWLDTVSDLLPGLSFVLGYVDEFAAWAGWNIRSAGIDLSLSLDLTNAEIEKLRENDDDGDWMPLGAADLPLPSDAIDQLPNRHALAIEAAAQRDDERFSKVSG